MFFNFFGESIYFEKCGEGKTIIFLHGWGSNLTSFYNVADVLVTKYQVYLIDLPSFGNSQEPSIPLSIQDMSNLLESFINHYHIINPIIIAHSYGGRIAIEYASSNENLDKLILIDSAGIKRHSIIKCLKIAKFKLLKSFYKHTHQLSKYNNLNSYGSTDYQNSSSIQKGMLIQAVNYNQVPLLKKISKEVLLIFGEHDKITPIKDAKLLKKHLKNSALVIIKNASHFPFIENPYYFNQVIKAYLEVK